MISGLVTAAREAVLDLVVYGVNGQSRNVDAIVDTGFTGWFTLPPHIIAALGLIWKSYTYATLADGSRVLANVYEAAVEWDGQTITIPIAEANADPLIGMSLMYGYQLVMPIIDGGTFTLTRLSNP